MAYETGQEVRLRAVVEDVRDRSHLVLRLPNGEWIRMSERALEAAEVKPPALVGAASGAPGVPSGIDGGIGLPSSLSAWTNQWTGTSPQRGAQPIPETTKESHAGS